MADFDVFLSHNSKDKPTVRELAEALKARGLRVWLDEWELIPGRPWQEAVEEIIRTVPAAAVLVGRDGLGPWEIPEMHACISQFVRRRLPVIPVLLPGVPERPELPLFLGEHTWVDLRGGLSSEGLDLLEWGITGRKPERPAPGSPAQASTTPASPPASGALALWREKLEFLREQEVITSDAAQKFALKKQIEEAQRKIRELGGAP